MSLLIFRTFERNLECCRSFLEVILYHMKNDTLRNGKYLENTPVGREIVDWHFDGLSVSQPHQSLVQQVEIEGIRMVKVVLLFGR